MQQPSITCFESALFAVAYQQFVRRQFLHADGLMEALSPTECKYEHQTIKPQSRDRASIKLKLHLLDLLYKRYNKSTVHTRQQQSTKIYNK